MRYTVVWQPSAVNDLAAIWLAARNRAAVTAAADEFDRVLRHSPENLGDIRFDTVRTFVIHPLGIDFEVIEADRIVNVLFVWDVSVPGANGIAQP
jgi:hypothetical protein